MLKAAIVTVLLTASPAFAQQPPPTFGCEKRPEFRQFDFWVGEWEVRPTGVPNFVAGTSSIQLINGSCTVLENWTGGKGGVGKSFNLYNAATKKWQQIWVDNSGGLTIYTGEYRDKAMRFDSGERVAPNGTTSKVRLTFFHVAADTVRQLGENSADGGQTWTTGYDLTYVRRK